MECAGCNHYSLSYDGWVSKKWVANPECHINESTCIYQYLENPVNLIKPGKMPRHGQPQLLNVRSSNCDCEEYLEQECESGPSSNDASSLGICTDGGAVQGAVYAVLADGRERVQE